MPYVSHPRLQKVDHNGMWVLDVGINERTSLSGGNPDLNLDIADTP